MNYTNRLKGSVTQALVRALLTDAGISVVPLGIEEVIREVSELDAEQYLRLGLPDTLRKLPDFFAANRDRTKSWLLEVKFRSTWTDEVSQQLYVGLKEQVATWNPLHLILFFGDTPSLFPKQPSSWIRVAKLIWQGDLFVETEKGPKHWFEVDWKEYSRIQDVFPEIGAPEKWEDAVLDATIAVSRGLVSLS